jgi:hypothetical protein
MSDGENNTGPRNGNRVSLTEDDDYELTEDDDYEVQFWTKALGLSERKLVAEIKKHGNSAWLRKHRQPAAVVEGARADRDHARGRRVPGAQRTGG